MPYSISQGNAATFTEYQSVVVWDGTHWVRFEDQRGYDHQDTHPIGSLVRIVGVGRGWDGTEGIVIVTNGDPKLVHTRITKLPVGNFGRVGHTLRFYPKNCRVLPTFLAWARKHK